MRGNRVAVTAVLLYGQKAEFVIEEGLVTTFFTNLDYPANFLLEWLMNFNERKMWNEKK